MGNRAENEKQSERWLSDDYVIDFCAKLSKTSHNLTKEQKIRQNECKQTLKFIIGHSAPVLLSCEKKSEERTEKRFSYAWGSSLGSNFPPIWGK